MTRKRATVSEKKQRRAYVLRMIGEGCGLSEPTTHIYDSWGYPVFKIVFTSKTPKQHLLMTKRLKVAVYYLPA